jgi:hypothetical protein
MLTKTHPEYALCKEPLDEEEDRLVSLFQQEAEINPKQTVHHQLTKTNPLPNNSSST